MALFKTAQGKHWHTDEQGRTFAIFFRIYEDDKRDGFARAILTQMPGSTPLAEAEEPLTDHLILHLEYHTAILLCYHHLPPDSANGEDQFFQVGDEYRKEVPAEEVAFWIIPQPLETSWAMDGAERDGAERHGDEGAGDEGNNEPDDYVCCWDYGHYNARFLEVDERQLTLDFEAGDERAHG